MSATPDHPRQLRRRRRGRRADPRRVRRGQVELARNPHRARAGSRPVRAPGRRRPHPPLRPSWPADRAPSPSAIAGLIELRGIGIVETPFLAAAVVRLVVDLADAPERMPERSGASGRDRRDHVTAGRRRAERQGRVGSASSVVLAACFVDGGCDPFALAQRTRTGGMKHPGARRAEDPDLPRARVMRGGQPPERDEVSAETA